MSTVERLGVSLAAAFIAVVVATLLNRYVLDSAITTTMCGLVGTVAFFIVSSLIKRS